MWRGVAAAVVVVVLGGHALLIVSAHIWRGGRDECVHGSSEKRERKWEE